MTPPLVISALEMPALWVSADRTAADNQRRFYLARAAELAGLVLAALLATVPSSFAGGAASIATLVLFVGVLLLQVTRVGQVAEKGWYDARAAAESIKTASWQYAVGGEAFRLTDPLASNRFVGTLQRILQTVPHLDVGAKVATPAGPTDSMERLRTAARADRLAAYLRLRVDDQIGWYSEKAAWNKKRAFLYTTITVLLELAAVVAGVIQIRDGAGVNLLSVAAAGAVALVGWTECKKYAFLAESYGLTSHEVGLVATTLADASGEDAWAQSVHDAEAAFSREHTLWQARRQGPA